MGDERRDGYDDAAKRLYPDKIVKDVNIGKKCREWYQIFYDYAPNLRNPELNKKIINLIYLLDMAFEKGIDLDDKSTAFGKYWDMLIKYYYQLGMNFRLTMDSTKNELTRLLTRK